MTEPAPQSWPRRLIGGALAVLAAFFAFYGRTATPVVQAASDPALLVPATAAGWEVEQGENHVLFSVDRRQKYGGLEQQQAYTKRDGYVKSPHIEPTEISTIS